MGALTLSLDVPLSPGWLRLLCLLTNSRDRGDGEKGGWVPVTKLGRLVKSNKVKSIEEVFLFSLPIKEVEIVDHFFPSTVLKDEVMRITPVQKQTRAGQRTRFKAYVAVGDTNGHLGLGVKCASEVANAIRGALILAKTNLVPVRRGYWGSNMGSVHTVAAKVTGSAGSISLRLIPAPRGAGLVASIVPRKLLKMAGIVDVFTSTTGKTATQGNFLCATYDACARTYHFLSPELWPETYFLPLPFHAHSDFLSQKNVKPARRQRDEDDQI